jgi:hypothetical protein
MVRKEGGCAAEGVIGDGSGSAVLLVREMVEKCEKCEEKGCGRMVCFIVR